jgi:hypothetical protein
MTVNSMRQVAAANTLTSHHCELLLTSLTGPAQGIVGKGETAASAAAQATRQARSRLLGIAHALDQVTTPHPGQLPQTAVTAEDLALWTGRLAYTDPGWTLDSASAPGLRSPRSPAREPDEAAHVLAAVHDACDAMNHLADADRRQVRALASAGTSCPPPGPRRTSWTCWAH